MLYSDMTFLSSHPHDLSFGGSHGSAQYVEPLNTDYHRMREDKYRQEDNVTIQQVVS